jgi:hypothetical protein
MAFYSALGLAPSDDFHTFMTTKMPGTKILTGDYKLYDLCFSPHFFPHVARVIRSMAAGRALHDEIINEDDYIRTVLLKRLQWMRLQYGSEIFEPGSSHPSGSVLTTLINIIGNVILFSYGLAKMLNIDPVYIDDFVLMLFLGDDSFVAVKHGENYDVKVLVDAIAACGFLLTGTSKSGLPVWHSPYSPNMGTRSEYTFLGRHFTCLDAVLEFDRVVKILKFCETSSMLIKQP